MVAKIARKREKMRKKAAPNCIKENDLETAYERYQETTTQWKSYWWETIETIYNNCKDWTKKYILDPVNKILIAIKEKTKAKLSILWQDRIVWECQPTNEPCAYIVEHFDQNGNFLWLKVGKAIDGVKTIKGHFYRDTYKKANLGQIVVKHLFVCPDEEEVEKMESTLRKYYKSNKNGADFIRNDRFSAQRFSTEVLNHPKIKAQYDLCLA